MGMMMRRSVLFALVLLVAMASRASAQARPYTPARGTPERQALMDALRVPLQRQMKKPMIFEVSSLKVYREWAFAEVVIRKPGGSPFDYHGTPYQEAIDEGMFEDMTFALLHLVNGRWRVVRYAVGPTDVAWLGWADTGAPREVFPNPEAFR
jgi:hypothetical protein